MRDITIAHVWGIPIRLNISLLVFIPVIVWLIGSGAQIDTYTRIINGFTAADMDLAALRQGIRPWLIGSGAAVGLFASVTLHELGHSWAARRYGIHTESITLWIFGGIASLSDIPREWHKEFWIAIAGPIVSVLTGAVCFVLVIPLSTSLSGGLSTVTFVFGWLAITNLVLAVFNLVPAFPMDGGRILRALLARKRPYASATRTAARVGVVFAILFAVVGVLSFNLILLLVALFVYGAATTESRYVLLDELLGDSTVGEIMTQNVDTVDAAASVDDLLNRMFRDRRTVFPVAENGRVVGVVALEDLKRVSADQRATTRIGTLAHDVPHLDAGADAFDTLAVLNSAGTQYAIVETDGELSGLLSQGDYAAVMNIRKGFQAGLQG
jgi:Zn-dependent protease/predicted transcriptional regulator